MIKRGFDLVVVIVMAPVWLLVLGFVALLVRLRLGSPVFFSQKRPGRNARIFDMIKFRTMTNARDANGNLLPDADRITPFGKWLRSTSFDEMPELFNVLRGEMSLVGPRPLLTKYLERYTPRQARRHEVRPGLTGLSQVKGRNALSWDEKLEWDVRYVETQSFWLDVKILALTLKAVFVREGISAAGEATMPEFRGSVAKGPHKGG
jgi:sugar transferase EpsL